jgi:hypothetical protein
MPARSANKLVLIERFMSTSRFLANASASALAASSQNHSVRRMSRMKMFRSCRFLPLLVFSLIAVRAADPAAVKRAITAEDLWAVKRPGALDLSPDGARLVFNVQEYDLEKNTSQKHLWVLDAATGVSRELTTADPFQRRDRIRHLSRRKMDRALRRHDTAAVS